MRHFEIEIAFFLLLLSYMDFNFFSMRKGEGEKTLVSFARDDGIYCKGSKFVQVKFY